MLTNYVYLSSTSKYIGCNVRKGVICKIHNWSLKIDVDKHTFVLKSDTDIGQFDTTNMKYEFPFVLWNPNFSSF